MMGEGALGQRRGALDGARVEFASKCLYGLPAINLWVVGHRLDLPCAIACDDTPAPVKLPVGVRSQPQRMDYPQRGCRLRKGGKDAPGPVSLSGPVEIDESIITPA